MNQLEIEPFRNRDIDGVIKLLATSFQSKFETMVSLSNTQIISLLKDSWNLSENNPSDGHFVAKVGGKIAGVILLKYASQKREDENINVIALVKNYGLKNMMKYLLGMYFLDHQLVKNECYIEHIAIDPSYRGMGIGSQLILYGKEFAKTLPDISNYSLSVAKTNVEAFKLYKRLGFEEMNDKSIDSSLMKWLVGERKWLYMAATI